MMDSTPVEAVQGSEASANVGKSAVADATTGPGDEEVPAISESNGHLYEQAKGRDVEANWTDKEVETVAENAIPMPHVVKAVSVVNEQDTDDKVELNKENLVSRNAEESQLTALEGAQSALLNAVHEPSLTLKTNSPGTQSEITSFNEMDSYAVSFAPPSPSSPQKANTTSFMPSWASLGKAHQIVPMADDGSSSHDAEFEPDALQVETIVEKSFTAARRVLGVCADPSQFSGRVQIFGADEVISKMNVTKMEKNFLLTRWMKARNSQKDKAKTNANYFRMIGLTKVLCGVLVPVIISTLGTVSKSSIWNTVLANSSIVLSVLGTFATALEDFFQFGVRAANRTTCLSKLDRVFWEFQGMSGQFEDFQEQSGDAFRHFAFACEQNVFMVEDLHLSAMFSSDEKEKNSQQKNDKQTSPSFKEAVVN